MSTFTITNDDQSGFQNMEVLKGFIPLVCITECVGLVGVGLILVWAFNYSKGLGFDDPQSEFSLHPFFMSLGLIYLMSNAILTFRILREHPKKKLKLLHASLHGIVFILVAIAVYAVIDFHNRMKIPNFYSVHAWMGLFTVILFMIQFCLGFSAFLFPGLSGSIRAFLMPYHVFFGNVILVMAIGSAMTGINEKAIFNMGNNYGALPSQAIMLNTASLLFIIFGILMTFLTTRTHYKRYPRPVDSIITSGISS